jgi:deoxyribonuclease IV
MLKIGAHISTRGGLKETALRATAMGAECMQIFAGSPRRYEVSFFKNRDIKEYLSLQNKEKIKPVYIHASYLINLASEDKEILEKSKKSLKDGLVVAKMIFAEGVVYHPGSPKGKSKEEAILREIESIKEILEKTPQETTLIIENTAGEKKIGTTVSEISCILKKVNSSRLKVCIDTAHSFEAGIIEKFDKENIKKWLTEWKEKVGLENIVLFHINDSLTARNSHHDRHANIGEGYIGKKGFENLMSFSETRKIPWILEVPGKDGKGPDKENIAILKKMRKYF